MRVKAVLGVAAALAAVIIIAGNVHAASMADFNQALAEAKASLKKAASVRGEWRDSGKMLKAAEKAAKDGNMDAAMKLVAKAKQQGEMGYDQALHEQALAPTLSELGGNTPQPRPQSPSASKFRSSPGPDTIKEGRELAYNRKKGNCLGCHRMDDGVSPGNIGPPLTGMKARYREKGKLRAQIWDATVANPETLMPPFGRQKVLSEAEIDKITEYVWSL